MTEVPMTAAERREFIQFTRQYVRGVKALGEAHAAQLALACEEELSRTYEKNDERWAEAVAEAEKVIAEAEKQANDHIEAVLAERGLTNRRRMPRFVSGRFWLGRGETFDKDRRAELRQVAAAQAKLVAKAAVAEAERIATGFQQEALGEQWSLAEAIEKVRALPKVAELMPPLDPREVHEVARQQHAALHSRRPYTVNSFWPELNPGDEEASGDE